MRCLIKSSSVGILEAKRDLIVRLFGNSSNNLGNARKNTCSSYKQILEILEIQLKCSEQGKLFHMILVTMRCVKCCDTQYMLFLYAVCRLYFVIYYTKPLNGMSNYALNSPHLLKIIQSSLKKYCVRDRAGIHIRCNTMVKDTKVLCLSSSNLNYGNMALLNEQYKANTSIWRYVQILEHQNKRGFNIKYNNDYLFPKSALFVNFAQSVFNSFSLSARWA